MTPSALDMSQEYNDLLGSIKNPLGQFGDSNQDSVGNRGGFANYFVVSNTPTQAIVDCLFCEPIFLSPFYWGCGNATAFINVQDMAWNFTFVNNPANRMWSHNTLGALAPAAISSSSVNLIILLVLLFIMDQLFLNYFSIISVLKNCNIFQRL